MTATPIIPLSTGADAEHTSEIAERASETWNEIVSAGALQPELDSFNLIEAEQESGSLAATPRISERARRRYPSTGGYLRGRLRRANSPERQDGEA